MRHAPPQPHPDDVACPLAPFIITQAFYEQSTKLPGPNVALASLPPHPSVTLSVIFIPRLSSIPSPSSAYIIFSQLTWLTGESLSNLSSPVNPPPTPSSLCHFYYFLLMEPIQLVVQFVLVHKVQLSERLP